MSILPQVSMPFVRLLYRFWLDQGVDQQVLDDILRVDIGQEGLTKFGISSIQLAQLHQAAIEHTKDLSLGIKLGQYIAKQHLSIGDVVLAAPTLKNGLVSMMSHSRAISESGYFEMNNQGDDYQVLNFIPYEGIVFSSHQQNMVIASIITWILKVNPEAEDQLIFQYDSKIFDSKDYKKLLNCQLISGDEVSLKIPNILLLQGNENYDEELYQVSLKQVKKILKKRDLRLELYSNVGEAIKHCLLERNANQENVASKLNLSVRNLQRRLKEVGSSYQTILDDNREELAMSLLKDHDIPLYEIACLVGFTEPSAFYKAFRRWTGKRPGDYRQDATVDANDVGVNVNEVLSEGV